MGYELEISEEVEPPPHDLHMPELQKARVLLGDLSWSDADLMTTILHLCSSAGKDYGRVGRGLVEGGISATVRIDSVKASPLHQMHAVITDAVETVGSLTHHNTDPYLEDFIRYDGLKKLAHGQYSNPSRFYHHRAPPRYVLPAWY